MTRRLDRRRRRLFFTLASAGAFLAGAVAWITVREPEALPYRPGQETEGITRSLGREIPDGRPNVTFRDVASTAGIDFRHFPATRTIQLPEDMGSGAAWGDYDGDGWFDLYLVNVAGSLGHDGRTEGTGTNALYRNRGDGSFEDVTQAAGVGMASLGMGAAWADYDRDGDLDLAVSSYGRLELFRNDGGQFSRQGEASGVAAREGFWTGLAWGDYDADGDPDLYACAYVAYAFNAKDVARSSEQYGSSTPFTLNPSSYPPAPNLLLQNQGDGTFVDVAGPAGVANAEGRSLAAAWTDLNGDGRLDLYVANDVSASALFLGAGDGTFVASAAESLLADYRGAMGIAIGDRNADGDLDLFITHWIAQENALYDNLLVDRAPASQSAASPALVRPLFSDIADGLGLGQSSLDFVGWGDGFLDYDLDGRADLFAVNGHTMQDAAEPTRLLPMRSQLFWNAGEEGYFDVGDVSGPGFATEAVSRGAAIADFDGDGDPDVVVVDHGGPARLLMSEGATNAWLKVRLEGRDHRDVTGARIDVEAEGRAQMQEYATGGPYLSQHAPEAIFGLGAAESVDRVRVAWPGGEVEEVTAVPARHTVTFVEGEGARVVALPPAVEPPASASQRAAAGSAAGGESVTGRPRPAAADERARVQAFWTTYQGAQERMRSAQDWAGAADGFRRALEIDPTHEDAMYYLGASLYELGDYPGAVAQFQRLVAAQPMSLRGHLQLGSLQSMPAAGAVRNLEAAAESLERAVQINPEESGALGRLGGVQLALGRLDAAETSLRQARTLNERAVDAFYLGGYVARRLGKQDDAVALLRQAVETAQPQEPAAEPLSEGDTQRADRSALVSSAHAERLLYGALLTGLGAIAPDAVDAAFADAEYARVDAYLEALGASSP